MIKTHLMLMDQLKGYASPRAKITRMLRSGDLFQLRRGLFVDDLSISPLVVAPVLYGPSYISFQYAMAAAGLIPERVRVVTSASFNKSKDKVFRTPVGEFRYLYLPPEVYPYGIRQETENGSTYLIASAEKALCDSVYKVGGLADPDDVAHLVLDEWRIDAADLAAMDRDFIRWIAPMYRRRGLRALATWSAEW